MISCSVLPSWSALCSDSPWSAGSTLIPPRHPPSFSARQETVRLPWSLCDPAAREETPAPGRDHRREGGRGGKDAGHVPPVQERAEAVAGEDAEPQHETEQGEEGSSVVNSAAREISSVHISTDLSFIHLY